MAGGSEAGDITDDGLSLGWFENTGVNIYNSFLSLLAFQLHFSFFTLTIF